MNKQYALYVFSDVIEIVVKIGRLYLHTLGKQEKMFGELTEAYFPENNVQEEDNDNEMVYHPFTSP